MAKTVENQIEFTGVKFVDFHFVGKPKRGPGGPSLRIYFEAQWSEEIRDAMGWTDIDQETVRGTPTLRGALVGTKIVLSPKAGELSDHTIKVDAPRIGNFEVFFPEQTGKKPKAPILRFRVETHQDKAETIFGKWGRELAGAEATMAVAYAELQKKAAHSEKKSNDDDKQEELPLTGAAKEEHEQRQAGHKGKTTTIRRVKK